jgi:hypothetical protein
MFKSRKMGWAGHIAVYGRKEVDYSWNIKMYREDTGWQGVNWIYLAQDKD